MARARHALPALRASLPAAVLLLAACGDAPPPEASPSERAHGPPRGDLAPALDAEPTVRGAVVLAKHLAGTQEGALYVILRSPGETMPVLSRKYGMDDPAWSEGADGTRRLEFVLDGRHTMGGTGVPPAGDLEVEARFDRDGFVETRQDSISRSVPVANGQEGIEVRLGAGG